MAPRTALLALLPLIPLTLAQVQNFIPSVPSSSFPACGFACTVLQQAQASCIPPAAPITSQQTYNSCFCQSGLLAPWYTSPNGVCDPFCTNPADLTTLQNWYRGFCQQQTAAAGQPATTSTTGSVSTSSVPNSSSTSTATSVNTGSGSSISDNANGSASQGWFANHWRWVLMLILLVIFLPAFAYLIIYLKKRAIRKREAAQLAHNGGVPPTSDSDYHHHNFFGGRWRARANSASKPVAGSETRDFGGDGTLGRSGTSGTMSTVAGRTEMWGPHQGMAHTRGWGDYSSEDLQASSSGRGGVGEKAAEAAIAARSVTSDGRRRDSTRMSTRSLRDHSRKRRHNSLSKHASQRGKGKGRGLGGEIWEDEVERPVTEGGEKRRNERQLNKEIWEDETERPVTAGGEKRRKRRSKSQRERREKDLENDASHRFSM